MTTHTCARGTPHAWCRNLVGYKDGLQPESLADGNWLVKQNQPVSKIETTNLRSLYESLIQECIDLKISDTVMTS
jgi:hypothetical protein